MHIQKELADVFLYGNFHAFYVNPQKITEREVESSIKVCSMLIKAIERQQAGLVEELQERQDEAERRAQELLDELEREINELQTRSSELQHLELAHNPLHLLQVRH